MIKSETMNFHTILLFIFSLTRIGARTKNYYVAFTMNTWALPIRIRNALALSPDERTAPRLQLFPYHQLLQWPTRPRWRLRSPLVQSVATIRPLRNGNRQWPLNILKKKWKQIMAVSSEMQLEFDRRKWWIVHELTGEELMRIHNVHSWRSNHDKKSYEIRNANQWTSRWRISIKPPQYFCLCRKYSTRYRDEFTLILRQCGREINCIWNHETEISSTSGHIMQYYKAYRSM
eukprot:960607_1